MFFGTGSGLVDNVRLEQKVDGQWQAIDIPNADFEEGESKPESWMQPVYGFELASVSEDVSSGKQSVRISQSSSNIAGKPIFKAAPALGEVVDAEIAPNLRMRFPLALPIDHSYKKGDDEATDKQIEKIGSAETASADQKRSIWIAGKPRQKICSGWLLNCMMVMATFLI